MSKHKEKFYPGYIKELTSDGILVMTNAGISGTIPYENYDEPLTIDLKNQKAYYQKHLLLKVGNACLLKVQNIDFARNTVKFNLEKNLSIRTEGKDYTRTLKKVN